MRAYLEPEYRRRIREKAEDHQRHAKEGQREAAKKNHIENLTAAIKRVEKQFKHRNNENTPEKKRDRLWERWGVGGLWIAAIVGLLAICISSCDADRQRGLMQGQLDEMKSQRRPWVFFEEPPTVQSLKWDNGSLYATIKFVIHNSGSTPALFVSPDFKIISNIAPVYVINEQHSICDEFIRTNGNSVGGVPIFPQQAIPMSIATSMPKDEIAKSLRLPDRPDMIGRFSATVSPIAVGCIDYNFPVTLEHHQTGFAYEIAASQGLPGEGLFGNLVPVFETQTIPAETVTLIRTLEGKVYFAN